MWNSNYITQMDANSVLSGTAQRWLWLVSQKRPKVINFQTNFYQKNQYSGYAITFAEAAKWLQIFKIGAGAQFNSSPLRWYRWCLAKALAWQGRGQARPAVSTQQPQDAGDTCIMQTPAGRESTECRKGTAADQICNYSGERTQSLEGYTRDICSCDEGTEDPRSHCQINSSQLTLHPPPSDQKEQIKKYFLWKIQIRRRNLSGSKSTISLTAIANKIHKRNHIFTRPSVLIINNCRNTRPTTKGCVIWHSSCYSVYKVNRWCTGKWSWIRDAAC